MDMSSFWHDVTSFHAAISICKNDGQWQCVAPLFNVGLALDMISSCTAISACENDGQLQHLLLLLNDMYMCRVWPDVTSFEAISACASDGQWHQLSLLLCIIIHMNSLSLNCFWLDVSRFKAAISACENDRQWQCVAPLFDVGSALDV
eukprot:11346105-Karenia_brevis.AAC.1